MSETVWLSGGSKHGAKVVHTDRDCPRLQASEANVLEKERSQVPNKRVCKTCELGPAGTRSSKPDRSIYNALRFADPEEVADD